jgi:hypothetical protein
MRSFSRVTWKNIMHKHNETPTTHLSEPISPLMETYILAGKSSPIVHFMEPDAIPEPYRRLLAHDNDMTPTLEAFHGDTTELKVISKHRIGNALLRQVVILTQHNARRVEFGAIRIFLDRFGPEARQQIIDCHRPLGSILASYAIPHSGHPSAFFSLPPDDCIREALALNSAEDPLYGRCNTISDPAGNPLAHIVEILPPANDKEKHPA